MLNISDTFFLPDFYNYLSVLLVSYVITYTIGRILGGFIPEIRNGNDIPQKSFNYVVLGFIIIIISFAMVWTKGNSIYIIAIFIFIVYFYKRDYLKEKIFVVDNLNKKEVSVFFVNLFITIFVYFVLFYVYFIRSNGAIWSDYIFYANISKSVINTHVESTKNLLYVNNVGAGIYHYTDIWFTALWTRVFDLNYTYTLILITYTYFTSLTIMGAIVLAKFYLNNFYLSFILGLSVMFVCPVLLIVLPKIENYYIFSEIAFFLKLSVVAVLIIFCLMFYLKHYKQVSYLFILLLIPFYSSVSIGIVSGLFSAQVFFVFKKNGFRLNTFLNNNNALILIVSIGFVMFYIVQPNLLQNSTTVLLNSKGSNFVLWTVKFFVKNFIGSIACLGFSIVVLAFLRRKENYLSFNFLQIFVFSGFFFSSFFASIVSNYDYNGYQLHSNFADVIITLIVFMIVSILVSKLKSKNLAYSLTISIFFIYLFIFLKNDPPFTYPVTNSISDNKERAFYNSISNEIKNHKKPIFGYYRNYAYLSNTTHKVVHTMLFLPLSQMIHIVPDGTYNPYCMSVLDIPDINNTEFDERPDVPFWRYVKEQKLRHPNSTFNDWTQSFIVKKNINFIVLEGNVSLPEFICNHAVLIAEYNGTKVLKINI